MGQAKRDFTGVKRVVVKLGSQVLTHDDHRIDIGQFDWLAQDICWLREQGVETVIVSSGAVAAGMGRLGMVEVPTTIPEKQAVAAVGQMNLMWSYKEVFGKRGLKVGQVLLTRDDYANRRRYQNGKNTLNTLLEMGIVPIINENDTVVVDEIRFGDNDRLSAQVTNLVEADLLILLSDVEGLYDSDPKSNPDAKIIHEVVEVDGSVEALAGGGTTQAGTGGMVAKLIAAKRACHGGADAVIGSGKVSNIVRRVVSGEVVGTHFRKMEDRLKRRKHWIAYTVKPTGRILVDQGAAKAILTKGKSLLSKGIVTVEGDFDRGDAVRIIGPDGTELAKGLTNYSAREVEKVAGLASWEIVDRLGYKYYDEIVHRDDMVVLI